MTLEGVIPPVATPLDASGDVDTASLQRLIEFQIVAGVNALWILGGTGEFQSLTDRQRQIVAQTAIESVAGRIPVLVGAMDVATARCIEQGRRLKASGADAIFVSPPLFVPATQAEIKAHCRSIHEAVDLPLVLYDARFETHTPIDFDTVHELAEEGTICGLKDSSGDWITFRQLVVEFSSIPNFAFLTGNEYMMDAALLMGAQGAIPTTANVIPEWYVALFSAARAGDWPKAARLQNRAVAINRFTRCGNPDGSYTTRFFIGLKSALKARGLIDTTVVGAPFLQPTPNDEAEVRAILVAEGVALQPVPADLSAI